MKTLSQGDRHFFSLVSRAAFSNPFSPEREALDHEIVGSSLKLPADELEKQLVAIIDRTVSRYEDKGHIDFKKFASGDRDNIETAWLFRLYHRYQRAFDGYIRDQEIQGEEPAGLPFAGDLEAEFEQCGFDPSTRSKNIALFFQLRRAFYFIHQAIAGRSDSIVRLRMQLWRNIFTFSSEWYWQFLCEKLEDFSTLLLGETGTGKSLVAQAIGRSGYIPYDPGRHRFTESFTRSYQSINLSQYPTGLLESELFGHKKGAFTGAIQSHSGIFARCSEHGAVFIDEIGDIDITTQVKLLTVLQDRLFSPVGSYEKLRFKGRVIAATNQDIHELRAQKRFRNDLYYRLCSDIIELPALRQRIEENPGELTILVERLIQRLIGTSSARFNRMIEKKILECVPRGYSWPGNVRELEQCIRQICLTGGYRADPNPSHAHENTDFLSAVDAGNLSARDLMSGYCRLLYGRMRSFERVARATGLDRRTIKKYLGHD
ncbi:MAG: sigma 54-interacting transcriptional regulator [Methylococcaceae bacterium]|nr:sigma 54-interacting transcriptional regulator [Methylococcaceae bacterium]